jgi:hypothetical protein
MAIDINFNFYSDARGGDPDSCSPTLRSYHKTLWSKPLPNGNLFKLYDNKKGAYLYHNSELGEFFLGSDAITHSYKNHIRKAWLTQQIPNEVDELFNIGSTIGAYTIFPNNKIDGKHTINQARGVNSLIDDRFDLTLECIRLFYLKQTSPLYDTLLRYKDFLICLILFVVILISFYWENLVDDKYNINFYLPFDGFITRPLFSDINDYLIYIKRRYEFH